MLPGRWDCGKQMKDTPKEEIKENFVCFWTKEDKGVHTAGLNSVAAKMVKTYASCKLLNILKRNIFSIIIMDKELHNKSKCKGNAAKRQTWQLSIVFSVQECFCFVHMWIWLAFGMLFTLWEFTKLDVIVFIVN
ncbi:hypothetical protein CRENBAI_009659 [Crenichthys baileyi]|uniref:Uncharacterized protein n=1 Tax=Crenichthys baileyi TaxID=28760 RepID=A0AAV9R0Q2_9TELE